MQFVPVTPVVRCDLNALIDAPSAPENCVTFDLQGDTLASRPTRSSGNTTTTFGLNATLTLLLGALDASRGRADTLLLSGSPSIGDALTDSILPSLVRSSVSHLALDACNVSAADAVAVGTLLRPQLQEGGSEFAESAVSTPALRTLSLARNELGADGAAALAAALTASGVEATTGEDADAPPPPPPPPSTLTSLDLSSTALGAAGAAHVAAALAAKGRVEEGGGAAVSSALPQLESLSLDRCGLGDDGAAAIARALLRGEGGRLVSLDLSGNGIGPRGIAALASALAEAPSASRAASLQTLILDGNHVGDEGAAALAAALTTHTALSTLSLHACAVGEAGAAALHRALRRGRGLGSLRGLWAGNDVPYLASGALEAAAARNRDGAARGGGAPKAAASVEARVYDASWS